MSFNENRILKFDNFIIILAVKKEVFNERNVVQDLEGNRKEVFKYRHFTTLHKMNYHNDTIVNDVFEFIEFIETLRAFSSKKLRPKENYKFKKFTAQIKHKHEMSYLHLVFESSDKYLDSFECSMLVSKFSKVLQRCEAWQG